MITADDARGRILLSGSDDWVSLAEAAYLVSTALPEGSDAPTLRSETLRVVAELAGGRMTVVDRVPESWRTLFVEVPARRNPQLLRDLHSQELPTDEQVQETKRLLQREFALHVDDDSEPTPRGRELDELTGDFIRRFVVEHT